MTCRPVTPRDLTFLCYDVPYGPVTDEDGNTKTDIYGNVITYEYYGGEQYIRGETAAEHEDEFREATAPRVCLAMAILRILKRCPC